MPMTHLKEKELEDLRANLETERDSLDEELAGHGKKIGGDWQGSSSAEVEEADPNDAADNIEELAVNVPLVEELERRREKVEKALAKMDSEGYGMCEVCNKAIPLDRLEANPSASTCVAHA